jgi:hypothetical protein
LWLLSAAVEVHATYSGFSVIDKLVIAILAWRQHRPAFQAG